MVLPRLQHLDLWFSRTSPIARTTTWNYFGRRVRIYRSHGQEDADIYVENSGQFDRATLGLAGSHGASATHRPRSLQGSRLILRRLVRANQWCIAAICLRNPVGVEVVTAHTQGCFAPWALLRIPLGYWALGPGLWGLRLGAQAGLDLVPSQKLNFRQQKAFFEALLQRDAGSRSLGPFVQMHQTSYLFAKRP